MPNLSIKNVPEEVVRRLRARAQSNHRSLQGELLELACQAARESAVDPVPERIVRSQPGAAKSIEQVAAEHRKRQPRPVADAPRASDLIRRERDAR